MASIDRDVQTVAADRDALRDEWLGRLTALIDNVEGWARGLGWATRRIDKAMDDHQIGPYRAPALLLQIETARLILEPIGWSVPDEEGAVDLYLMPAFDDVARLFYSKGGWEMYYVPAEAEDPSASVKDESKPFTEEGFRMVLEAMRDHAARTP